MHITSSNHDLINTKLNNIDELTKSALYNYVDNNNDVKFNNFITNGRFHALTSSPSKKSIISNFGQYDDHKFWQVTTRSFLTIEYDRVVMKLLKHQWNKRLGPVSLSGVDVFNIHYDCINGNLQK